MSLLHQPRVTLRFLVTSIVMAVIAGLLYLPGLPGQFLFDDYPNIVNNPSIQLTELTGQGLARVIATPQISGQMRGLPTLTFALDYWRGGGADPATFKSTNILIHAVTVFALAWLFRALLLASRINEARIRWLAPALALAWGAHPLLVSSVLYAVQRLQTMGTLFLVLALTAYVQARRAQIAGGSGRTGLMGAGLLWALAMACKEDSVLLPAYTLAVELTVLGFAAANAQLAKRLRRGYLIAGILGAVLYLFVALPHYWTWDAYEARDFSTLERLLTQARVLCMYLWQILVPLPSHMPFYYDWLPPSRSLLHPWTTMPAVIAVAILLGVAWRLRARQPLFALGLMLFFAAHFITSNVIGLELAFEHRNHFALIGPVLAFGSLLARADQRLILTPIKRATAGSILLLAFCSATAWRVHSWSNNLLFSQASTAAAPHSARAWILLCDSRLKTGGGLVRDNPMLDEAIEACAEGSNAAPESLNNLALLIVLKTIRGDIAPGDWDLFQRRLKTVQMSFDNRRSPSILTYNAMNGVALDKHELLEALKTLTQRVTLKAFDLASIGYFVKDHLAEPDLAMPYFIAAIEATLTNSPFPRQLSAELTAEGRPDLAEKITAAASH